MDGLHAPHRPAFALSTSTLALVLIALFECSTPRCLAFPHSALRPRRIAFASWSCFRVLHLCPHRFIGVEPYQRRSKARSVQYLFESRRVDLVASSLESDPQSNRILVASRSRSPLSPSSLYWVEDPSTVEVKDATYNAFWQSRRLAFALSVLVPNASLEWRHPKVEVKDTTYNTFCQSHYMVFGIPPHRFRKSELSCGDVVRSQFSVILQYIPFYPVCTTSPSCCPALSSLSLFVFSLATTI